MSWIKLAAMLVGGWTLLALGAGILLGEVVRRRDTQRPCDTQRPRDTHPAGRNLQASPARLSRAEVDRRFAGIAAGYAGDTR